MTLIIDLKVMTEVTIGCPLRNPTTFVLKVFFISLIFRDIYLVVLKSDTRYIALLSHAELYTAADLASLATRGAQTDKPNNNKWKDIKGRRSSKAPGCGVATSSILCGEALPEEKQGRRGSRSKELSPLFLWSIVVSRKRAPLGTLWRTRGMGQFGRSTTLPAQSGQDHMEAVPKPKSSGTSTEEDSSKKSDADVIVDKLNGLALKQQKNSEGHRRKLVKQKQKLWVEGRTGTTEPLTMPGPGHRSSMHFFTEDGCVGQGGGG